MGLPDEKRLLFEARGLLYAAADEMDTAKALLYSDQPATPSDVAAAIRCVSRMQEVLDVAQERLKSLVLMGTG